MSSIGPLRINLAHNYRIDENQAVKTLLEYARSSVDLLTKTNKIATELVIGLRKQRIGKGGMDAFLAQYNLSSQEGIALMCIAESMLRIPDSATVDDLIQDKLAMANWESYLGKSDSLFVNAATWSLMLTGKLVAEDQEQNNTLKKAFKSLLKRSSEPFIRQAVGQAMRILGKQFVMGRTINEALHRAKSGEEQGYRYSYDMLGEGARTIEDAERYFEAYSNAIHAIGKSANGRDVANSPGVSVKLSALYPRYEFNKRESVLNYLVPKVLKLACLAKDYNIGFTIDAEEAKRLELSLDIIENVFSDVKLAGWEGFGLAIQAYQKRCFYLIDWLVDLSKRCQRRLMVRLVKGAYWDSEIKATQVEGLDGYPVFTRKVNTDVSYIACAKKLLEYPQEIYPQFATHNAYSVAMVMQLAGERTDYEFQCLHGMGEVLYDEIVGKKKFNIPCRVYAPVGSHKDLLPYLVRRLLENGANSSFVNRIIDAELPIAELVVDPVAIVDKLENKMHPRISLPKDLYGNKRLNSSGIDLSNRILLTGFLKELENFQTVTWRAKPTLGVGGNEKLVLSPADLTVVGHVIQATETDLENALKAANAEQSTWQKKSFDQRAEILRRAADLLQKHCMEFYALAIREAGKTFSDAIAEVREAIDFCRYYAEQSADFPQDTQALGVVLCISPWNFPLAIFLGQVSAALVTGNAVLAKPADQTPLIAARAIDILHEAGVPQAIVQLIPGRGSVIGAKLVSNPAVRGIMFTGSTETAQTINRSLAARQGYDVPFIAETGGQNAMIVDSSALPEQVVDDVIVSAFGSAGQRCSALRVLFLQEDIADHVVNMLRGAMAELVIDDPSKFFTDIGPVIDAAAKKVLEQHAQYIKEQGKLIYQIKLSPQLKGHFFAPIAVEIDNLDILQREVFGPILHVVRYEAKELENVLQQIRNTGYGLTMGIHSRIEHKVKYIFENSSVGNTYVNRTMIGAVVGVQPFGGENLSGTGPKAGGPYYLRRLCHIPLSVADNFKNVVAEKNTLNQPEFISARIKIIENVCRLIEQKYPQQTDGMLRFYCFEAKRILMGPQIMSGPTGELNQLQLYSRGPVLIIVEDNDSELSALIAQISSVVLVGGSIMLGVRSGFYMTAQEIVNLFYQAGLASENLRVISTDDNFSKLLNSPEITAVMFAGNVERAIKIKEVLAQRTGVLIPLVLPQEALYYLERLSVERTLTVNTTASGGNAALLSLQEF